MNIGNKKISKNFALELLIEKYKKDVIKIYSKSKCNLIVKK
jgi:hypothetical protein